MQQKMMVSVMEVIFGQMKLYFFSAAAGDTFSWLKKPGPELKPDAALNEVINKTPYPCLEKTDF